MSRAPSFLLPFALLGLTSLTTPAHAVFVKDEMPVVDSETLFDSEYFLDLLSFSYPLDWQWTYDAHPGSAAYRANGASLDCCSLLWEQDLRLRRRLGERLAFAYDLAQRGDKDLKELHHWLSLEAGPWKGVSAGVFGEPTPDKEDSDIGAFLRWRPAPGWSARVSRALVDWNFNQRGSTTQRYDRTPFTDEAVVAWERPGERVLAALELDSPLVRKDPAQNLSYSYRRARARLRWDRRAPEWASTRGWAAEYAYETKREGRAFAPDPTLAGLDLKRRVHRLWGAVVEPLGERDRLEAGGACLLRQAAIDASDPNQTGQRLRRWELQPYARWLRRFGERGVSEAALFFSLGEDRRSWANSPWLGRYASPVEAKLDLGWDFLWDPQSRIGLHGSFDLDDLGRHLWDGGNIRAQFLF